MAKDIIQARLDAQKTGNRIAAANLQAQLQANTLLKHQTNLMQQEADQKALQKRIKAFSFEVRQEFDATREFKDETSRYIAANLVSLRLNATGLQTDSFEEIPDKTFFAETVKMVNQGIIQVPENVKADGDRYLNGVAKRLGEISLLDRAIKPARAFSPFLGSIFSLVTVMGLSKKVKFLNSALISVFKKDPVSKLAELIALASAELNRLIEDLNVFRSAYPEVSSMEFNGDIVEPEVPDLHIAGTPLIKKILLGSGVIFGGLFLNLIVLGIVLGPAPRFKVSAGDFVPAAYDMTFTPENLNDLDSQTSWQTSAGPNKWFQLDFEEPANISNLKIANGFQYRNHPKLGNLYLKNARIKSANVLVNGTFLKSIAFSQNHEGAESFALDQKKVKNLRVVITDLYPGTEWQEIAVSEVSVDSK